MSSEQPTNIERAHGLESQAIQMVLELRLDDTLTQRITRLSEIEIEHASPWLLCYQAMRQRLTLGDHTAALDLGHAAAARFQLLHDDDGYVRAMAEATLARYHLGQYMTALADIAACPQSSEPCCIAALALAEYVNQVGINALPQAIQAAQRGLRAIEHESNPSRRSVWRIVLQRNLAAAYHYQGELETARNAVEDAVRLAEKHDANSYLYDWVLYERGLLEQHAGRLDLALDILRCARARLERSSEREPIWRWVVAAEGHTLRDIGQLDHADACYRLGGWGEGDDGPLMLWLLQGRHTEAHIAAEARLAAAHASSAAFEVANLTVFLALLEFESGATPAIRTTLRAAVEQYTAIGFLYHRASALLHLAAIEYALADPGAGDAALVEALRFGATRGYFNFAWWHPARMRLLLRRALDTSIEAQYSARLCHERGLDRRTEGIPTLTLRCLGRFEVAVDGVPIPANRWQGHAAGAVRMQRMLLYLARHRAPQPIGAIARYVWPDSWDHIDVTANVHLTLNGLRRAFEPDLKHGDQSRFVMTTPGGYRLHPSLHVTIDLDQLQDQRRHAQIADATADCDGARSAFEQVEQLYAGDFALARPDPGEAEEYRHSLLESLRWLAADDLRRGALDSCIQRARRLLQEEPWDAVAPRLLIEAYMARGDRRAARRQYERYLKEHGEPSPEIVQLARTHRL